MTRPRVAPTLHAYLAAILAIGCLSAMDGAMKIVSLEAGALGALAWRALIAAPLLALLWLARRSPRPTREAMRFHLMRGIIMVPMSLGFFWGLKHVPMAQAIALTFIAPLLALVLAGAVLKEKIGGKVVLGSLIAFGGILLIFAGQARADVGQQAILGSLAILGSAMLYAVNIVLMRRQSQNSAPLEVALFYFLIAGAGFWLVAAVSGLPPFPVANLPALLLATLLSVLGMLGLAFAYARAEASYLSTSEYSGLVWATIFGFFLFGEVPGGWTVAGAALIVVGCLLAARSAPPAEPAAA